MSGKIWIDLTDLDQWRGPFGGTQRVVFGIAEALSRRDPDAVRFVAFARRPDRFVEVSLEPIVARTLETASSRPHVVHRPALVRAAQRVWWRTTRNTPEFRTRVKQVVRWALADAREVRRRIANARGSRAPSVGFDRDDVILILGKPWDEPRLQTLLDAEKRRTGVRIVELVYDLIPAMMPHLHGAELLPPYARQMFLQAQSSDLLLAISESTRHDYREFCRRLSLPTPPIDVVRIADHLEGPRREHPDATELPAGVASEFILCVGTVEVRKNHRLLYQALRLAHERGRQLPQLVILGGRGWLTDETWNLLTRDEALRDSVIIINGADDDTLRALYRRAQFLVYPSMYEGWGLPVAEALGYGKAVAASHTSSIPEIAGDLVSYFSPYSAEDCLDAMTRLLDPDVRSAAEARIAKEYVPTTWEETAGQVIGSLARHGLRAGADESTQG